MSNLILTQGLTTVILAIVVYGFSSRSATFAFLVGAVIVLINLVLTTWAWQQIFRKKWVALSVGVIVFKYAILGVSLYLLITREIVQPLWLSLGLATIVPTALVVAFHTGRQQSGQ